MIRKAVLIGALGLAAALGGCYYPGHTACYTACAAPYYTPARPVGFAPPPTPTHWDEPFADYTQRILTVSPTAGNAQAANAVVQTQGPWPAASYDTVVPADGPAMVKAVGRFENRGDAAAAGPVLGGAPSPPASPPAQ